jgi:hypothetical protein
VGSGGVDMRTDAFLHFGGLVGGVADAAEHGRAGEVALVRTVADAAAGGRTVGVPEDVVLSHFATSLHILTSTICLKKRLYTFAVLSTLSPP